MVALVEAVTEVEADMEAVTEVEVLGAEVLTTLRKGKEHGQEAHK
jgi:hypothetical protein